MKTLRLIGMALFAFLMCVNFSACSDNNDEIPETNEEGVVTSVKKLVEIVDASSPYAVSFVHDNKNRLTNIIIKKDGNTHMSAEWIWGDDIIMRKFTNAVGGTYSGGTYKLKNGLVIDYDDDKNEYNSSNQLTSVNDGAKLFTWENELLTKMEGNWGDTKIYYSSKSCKGYFPLMAQIIFPSIGYNISYFDEYYGLYIAHPELTGIRTTQLPNKIVETYKNEEVESNLGYTFTNDGYIESCTIRQTTTYSDGGIVSENIVYTFKWQ